MISDTFIRLGPNGNEYVFSGGFIFSIIFFPFSVCVLEFKVLFSVGLQASFTLSFVWFILFLK